MGSRGKNLPATAEMQVQSCQEDSEKEWQVTPPSLPPGNARLRSSWATVHYDHRVGHD